MLFRSDNIYGGVGADTLDGGAGDDVIVGNNVEGTKGSLMYGDSGQDRLVSSAGNDTMYGDRYADQASVGDSGNNDIYMFTGSFGCNEVYEFDGNGNNDIIAFNHNVENFVYGRIDNDLVFALDANLQTDTVFVKDWFTEFGIEEFRFYIDGTDSYKYITKEALAEGFGVEIPSVSTELGMAASEGCEVIELLGSGFDMPTVFA